MGKTASEWFDMLIEPYCSQAKENSNFQELREFHPSLHCAIGGIFTWSETKQGHEYWDCVYESTRNNETTYLKPTEPAQPQFGEWVKVEDGLPYNEGHYWCFNMNLKKAFECFYDGSRWGANKAIGVIVTHWMPLPLNPTN